MTTLLWECPECGCQNGLWETMRVLECPDCGTPPSEALAQK